MGIGHVAQSKNARAFFFLLARAQITNTHRGVYSSSLLLAHPSPFLSPVWALPLATCHSYSLNLESCKHVKKKLFALSPRGCYFLLLGTIFFVLVYVDLQDRRHVALLHPKRGRGKGRY
ncbi:hypothetical protein BC939DRAFT_469063 [Gamsiella multidivaricata]|uniref:uncharacterized protein n=1 Tax=Gamsiella multidivaricata TaxID=101098 RepID=UPI0022209363|nr:uncharacterized protein BC939DRAFT_469063 [Gamsiella multidivaricata]KAI7816445.1 hypothetical protein BC939DRAFT_469063 [Gamsiella multidivaricata]